MLLCLFCCVMYKYSIDTQGEKENNVYISGSGSNCMLIFGSDIIQNKLKLYFCFYLRLLNVR